MARRVTAQRLMDYAVATRNYDLVALLLVAGALEVLTPAPQEESLRERRRRLLRVMEPVTASG